MAVSLLISAKQVLRLSVMTQHFSLLRNQGPRKARPRLTVLPYWMYFGSLLSKMPLGLTLCFTDVRIVEQSQIFPNNPSWPWSAIMRLPQTAASPDFRNKQVHLSSETIWQLASHCLGYLYVEPMCWSSWKTWRAYWREAHQSDTSDTHLVQPIYTTGTTSWSPTGCGEFMAAGDV